MDARPRKSVTVSDRLVNSLVAEHLRAEHMDASLSVFLPESGCVGRLGGGCGAVAVVVGAGVMECSNGVFFAV